MDIHPLVVHFPIALLTLYSLIEIAALRPRFRSPERTHAKLILLFVGTLGSMTALQTGEIAQHLYADRTLILILHKNIAGLTSGIYEGISIFYLVQLALKTSSFVRFLAVPQLLSFLNTLITFITRRRLPMLAALIGFAGLNLTGGLGGILVYGPSADPITQSIYNTVQTIDQNYNISSMFRVGRTNTDE